MNPLDSIPTTTSISRSTNGAAISFTEALRVLMSDSTGVMSLNTIPFFGKSGTSLILFAIDSILFLEAIV